MDNAILSRIERLRINCSRRFTNRSRGEHLAGKGGQSTEFSDYRDYSDGDDMRYIDWNIFSRLRRPYMKIFHQEEEMHVVVLIDASASMQFEGKLDRAKQLGAAFGVMGMLALERVSCWSFNGSETTPLNLKPGTGRMKIPGMLRFIEGIQSGGDAPVNEGIESLLKHHRGRGVIIVLSDFLANTDLSRSMNLLYSSGLEIMGVQILGPTELEPDVTGDVRFVDCEDHQVLDVSSAASLMDLYTEYLTSYNQTLETACRKRGGRFITLNSGDSLEHLLFDKLSRKGWVK
jgi:uncharacterized protein (DUF58 family)